MAFAVEIIPGEAKLFRRIHKMHLTPEGVVSSQAYNKERLSVNWEKYATAEGTADENSAAVTALLCSECKMLNLPVEHAPVEPGQPFGPNQAHAEICGDKPKIVRRRLRDFAQTVWRR